MENDLLFFKPYGDQVQVTPEWEEFFFNFLEDCDFQLIDKCGNSSVKSICFDNNVFSLWTTPPQKGHQSKLFANFFHRSSGFCMNWNEFPLDSISVSHPISFVEFAAIIEECRLSKKRSPL